MLKKRGNQRVNEGETFNVSSNIHNINRAHRQKLLLLLISHKLCCCSLFVRENSQYSLSSFLLCCHLFTLAAAEAEKYMQDKRFRLAKERSGKITKILSLMQERANTQQQQQHCAPAVSLRIYMKLFNIKMNVFENRENEININDKYKMLLRKKYEIK